MVESVIDIIKSVLGFRQFSLPELENVKGELNLVDRVEPEAMFILVGSLAKT